MCVYRDRLRLRAYIKYTFYTFKRYNIIKYALKKYHV